MQIHALGLDNFDDEEYSLIGIHTALEDFKLAYLLNKHVHTNFSKSKDGLKFDTAQKKASFSLFTYTNIKFDYKWFLIANSFKKENKTTTNQLLLSLETKTYLISERKKIDYFIKITGDVPYPFVSETIQKINQIDQVITSYSIEKHTLKSKDFLIF